MKMNKGRDNTRFIWRALVVPIRDEEIDLMKKQESSGASKEGEMEGGTTATE